VTAPTKRVNRGGGHSYVLDGETVDGVTAICRDGIAKQNLVGWAARSVAGYAVDHWSELTELSTSKRLRELERAAWAERDAAAGRGTTIHKLAWQLAAGDTVEVPEALRGHVDAYLGFIDAYDVDEFATEATVISRRWRYMGTFDALAHLDGNVDELWLLDWKTGASGIWPETALQLAAYAHAESILRDDGIEVPMPAVAHAAAVWLRADGYDVVPVDISDETFRTFLYAQQLAHFTKAVRGDYVHDALPARTPEEVTS
jgi:hypothetical protein